MLRRTTKETPPSHRPEGVTRITSAAEPWYAGDIALATAPAVLILPLFIWFFWRIRLPFWDQFTMSLIFEKFYMSQLSFQDLWQAYNGHRILFPRIISLGLGILTHWQVAFEAVISNLLNIAIFLVVLRQIRVSLAVAGRRLSRIVLLFVSVGWFSLNQYENWFNGWDMGLLLAELSSIGALVFLLRQPLNPGGLVAAVVLAIVSSYSFGAGLAVWPAGCVALFLTGARPNLGALGVWAVAAAITAFLFILGSPPHERLNGGDLLRFPVYVASFVGAPLFSINGAKAFYLGPRLQYWLSLIAPCVGLIGFTGIVLLYLRAQSRQTPQAALRFPLLMCVFALMSGCLVAAGRSSYGLTQAMSPHYISVARLLWIGGAVFYCLVQPTISWPSNSRRAAGAVMGFMLFASYANGFRQLVDWHRVQLRAQAQLWTQYDDGTLRTICPILTFPQLHQGVEALKRNHLALYRGMQIDSNVGRYVPGNAPPAPPPNSR